jgi:hypothetical protein
MTDQKLATVPEGTMRSDAPRPLPYVAYPSAADVDQHGFAASARVPAAREFRAGSAAP